METATNENIKEDTIKIDYVRPYFHRRIFADLVDALIFILLAILVFMGVKSIFSSTERYKSSQQNINETRLNSHLYAEYDSKIVDIVTLYTNYDTSKSASDLKTAYATAMDSFIDYMSENVTQEQLTTIKESYNSFRLDSIYSGENYFITDQSGNIVQNPSCAATDALYNSNIYATYIQDTAIGFLTSDLPVFTESNIYMSKILFFVEIPVSVLIGAILAFYIPPLFFKRGRKTIGKLVYKIGRVDSNLLNVSFGKFTAESAILILGIVFLSCFTLGIPLIISFSLMAFSKNKQDFPDYMLGIQEVSTDNAKIYYSKNEINLENIKKNKDPVDFKMEDLK